MKNVFKFKSLEAPSRERVIPEACLVFRVVSPSVTPAWFLNFLNEINQFTFVGNVVSSLSLWKFSTIQVIVISKMLFPKGTWTVQLPFWK